MKKNSHRKILKFFFKTFFSLFIFIVSIQIYADPVVIKGVDGTWLPVLASSWSEKNNGVMLSPAKNIDPQTLRTKLLEAFPGMSIEIIGRNLFFPTVSVESLFSIIGGVDIGISLQTDEKAARNGGNIILDTKTPKALSGDNVIESRVESISFNEDSGKMFIDITITGRASKGPFRRYFGRQRIKVAFEMKDGTIDQDNPQNKKFAPLLLLKEGSTFSFIPEQVDSSRIFTISNFNIIKL